MTTTSSPSPNPSTSSQLMPPESPSSSTILKDEKEKTIPFLRQLTEMLQNNEELISFVPGQRLLHEIIHGKIIVHDRNRVQSEVLPVYFNHASFASLRRQLSYFSFVRVGKSRQSGVTYTNDLVVDLSDILKLKRRTSGGQAGGTIKRQAQRKRQKKQVSPPPPPPLPKQEQRQDEEHLAATASADDVASAVLSGTLHAAKTNDNLDINNNINSNNNGAGMLFSRVASSAHTSSAATQSSISQSNSSTEFTNGAPNEDHGRRDGAAAPQPKPPKGRAKCRGSSLISKHPPLPRKDRARFDRLLSINNIVPFIHLPAGHALGGGSVARVGETVVASVAGRRGDVVGIGEDRAIVGKENAPSYLRERATSHGAIDALLALGGVDRQ